MQPIAAVSVVFALVFSAIFWISLLRACFEEHVLLGLVAIFFPPLALILLLPRWQQEREIYLLALAALGFISIAAFF